MISTRKRIFILLCVIAIIGLLIRFFLFNGAYLAETANYRHAPGSPVLVMVFYEALCPDSKYFIMKQLLPAYKQAAALMDIQLVPYGKAQTTANSDGTFSFECQHGQKECQANMYHACAIEAIEDALQRIELIACMIKDNRQPKEAMHKCAKQHGVENIDLIQKCYDSTHAGELLKINGDATNALRPPISFIPTITIDGSQGRQASILKDLLGEVCKIVGTSVPACSNKAVNH